MRRLAASSSPTRNLSLGPRRTALSWRTRFSLQTPPVSGRPPSTNLDNRRSPYDKQYVRDYLESVRWNKQPPTPALPDEASARTSEDYRQAYQRLTRWELELNCAQSH